MGLSRFHVAGIGIVVAILHIVDLAVGLGWIDGMALGFYITVPMLIIAEELHERLD